VAGGSRTGSWSARDAVATVVAGIGAAWVMNRATTAIYERQSEASRRREEEVGEGVAYAVVVRRVAGLVGHEIAPARAERLGEAFHYAMGAVLAPGYVLLRRRFGLPPVTAGLAFGLSVSVVVDELANPLLGFTAPPQSYPLVTHVRGIAGHVVFGLTMAGLFEVMTGPAAASRRKAARSG
jgi:Protein of unknown function (DUF1440)